MRSFLHGSRLAPSAVRRLARAITTVGAAVIVSACASGQVRFANATPGKPLTIVAEEWKPEGSGKFPAVVLLHTCHGVSTSTRDWAHWFKLRGYVALVVDSWGPRGITKGCVPSPGDVANTERFDDTVGALRYLHGQAYVDRERVGVIGWSNGGVFSMAVVNGPSHERARARGVSIPEPGFRAAVAVYPGGCWSLVNERVVRPLLVLVGSDDDWIRPKDCIDMVNAMRAKGADAAIVVFPGAAHYFDVVGQPHVFLWNVENRSWRDECCGATIGYDPAADAQTHRFVADFFDSHLKGAR